MKGMTRPGTLLRAASFSLLACASAAAAQRAALTGSASLRLGVSSNPFLETGAQDSAYGELEILPRLEFATPLGETVAQGFYRRTQYTDAYDGTDEFEARLLHERDASERVHLSFEGEFASRLIGQREVGIEGESGVPQIDPDTLDPQAGLFGGRQRRRNFSARANVNFDLNEASTLNSSYWAIRSDYSRPGVGQSYWSYGGSADYSRALGPRGRIGARLSYEWTDYDSMLGTNAFVLEPQLHYERRVNQWLTVDVGAGAIIVEESFAGDKRVSTSLGGSLRSCITHERSAFCAVAARDASGTGLGSVRTRTNFNLTYTNRLNQNDQLRVGAEYSRVAGDRPIDNRPPQGASTLLNLFGYLETRIARRVAIGSNLSYRRLSDANSAEVSDFNGQVFVRIEWGPRG